MLKHCCKYKINYKGWGWDSNKHEAKLSALLASRPSADYTSRQCYKINVPAKRKSLEPTSRHMCKWIRWKVLSYKNGKMIDYTAESYRTYVRTYLFLAKFTRSKLKLAALSIHNGIVPKSHLLDSEASWLRIFCPTFKMGFSACTLMYFQHFYQGYEPQPDYLVGYQVFTAINTKLL